MLPAPSERASEKKSHNRDAMGTRNDASPTYAVTQFVAVVSPNSKWSAGSRLCVNSIQEISLANCVGLQVDNVRRTHL